MIWKNKIIKFIFCLILIGVSCFFIAGFDENNSTTSPELDELSESLLENIIENFNERTNTIIELERENLYLKEELDKALKQIYTEDEENRIQGFYDSSSNIFKISTFIVIAVSVIALGITVITFTISGKNHFEKKIFFQALLEGLKLNSVNTNDDLINIYKGIAKISPEDFKYRYGLNEWLREFLTKLISKKIDNTLDDKTVKVFKDKISYFILENEKISPFADLPKIERSIFRDLEALIKERDFNSIKQKLKELSGLILTRKYEIDRSQNINKYSVPIAIIGLVLTIIFGLISIYK